MAQESTSLVNSVSYVHGELITGNITRTILLHWHSAERTGGGGLHLLTGNQ